ncbi:MAG: fused response regulator/phosphatase [Candidatus Poribacteria bacterium]|nr:MAG: fused response regulator/phosphatase [Candidatus Poribacteria bacterium]
MAERILVVDDEPDVLDLVELVLAPEGFEVLLAKDGLEALDQARSNRPELILLDLSMPGMDGFQVIEKLREDPSTASIPVVMLTARAQISDKLRGLSSGADDYITKPFDPDELVERVRAVLARQKRPLVSSPLLGTLEQWSGEIEQLARHLETAAQIQQGLLPQSLPTVPGFSIGAVLESSLDVSGDFYDFLPLEGDRVGIALADVRGKGIPAALLMVMVRTVIRIVAREVRTPAELVKRVNDFLASETSPELFTTMVYAVLDPRERTLAYCNGGHCYPLLFRNQGEVLQPLTTGGMLVGAFELAEYQYETIALEPGDLLLLYTDGVTEAESPEGEPFGEDRLVQLVRENIRLTPPELCVKVKQTVQAFRSAQAHTDDLTVLAVQVVS